MNLSLAFSPCPNDTFIFDALVNSGIDTGGLRFDVALEDVETLNQWALRGEKDITKLSFSALLKCSDEYQMLQSGAALGRGVGPLLITADSRNAAITPNADTRIAIPGKNTTANLLLSLAFPEAKNKTEVIFSEIEAAVLRGGFDAGLIIHESRFTYADRGLHKIIDLGEWWEQTANAPIPLGCIAAKKSLGQETIARLEGLIRWSLESSWSTYPQLSDYVRCHAQEMDEAVMRQHIDLYVNDFTKDLGEEGNRAVDVLFTKARAAGLIFA